MRVSKLFGKTLREIPAEADTVSHQLLVRAGMVNQLVAGVYSYLPLAWRVLQKIENIVREEMDRAGGQELSLPVLQPLELWQLSGRGEALGKVLFTLYDRRERPLALGPTHEEVITQLVSRNVRSYRDLPLMLYQIQTKFRDEPRPRGGLIRVREFPMKDLYSFDTDEAGLDVSYRKMIEAYRKIYERCGLPALLVEADSGAIGGKDSHEFMLVAGSGEDEIIYCPGCDYAANVEKAVSVKGNIENGAPRKVEEVSTPGMGTIEEVAGFLKVPHSHTLKAVFYVADGKMVFVVIRGDLAVNEIKLKNRLRCTELRLATEAEVIEAGIVAGAASPVGLSGFKVVADDSVSSGTNFVAGGNKPDTHLRNVNYPRDFKADIVADIATARAGERCASCGGVLASTHGIEVGHVFKLGTFLSEKLEAVFIDEKGETHPIVMGCYGIGIGRLLAAAIEQSHDAKGIIWPAPIAPYHVYLCPLYREGTKVTEVSEKLYGEFLAAGLEVLYDDREESPGVKFNDADLLGIPFRVTVSPRTLQKESVELKRRNEKESALVPLAGIADKLKGLIKG
ncbi:MAG TPA: proline--tRNA ligase [Dehalococcoidales bacterium]|nr:MAG: proline--tRNA ligase [Chloroflexi bacterium RBG_16_60_22]HJX13279.1 proline--tRNA ligase [Dehalococcoidales bacterium]